ncbi:MAG: hypothetical protein Kow0042_10360 [Calditrichia bacterium]
MPETKILVVDDDSSSRLFLQKVLEKENYPITLCNDGVEALEVLGRQYYDLVITDLKMESIDGIELLEKIKYIDPEIAVIILTGHASIKTAIEALRLGASDYLIKPVNIEELRIRVKKALERKELERRLKEAERRITYNATITTANHEINQPLTVILSGSDMIRMELERKNITDQKIFNYLQLTQKAVHRIAEILRRFREISSPTILKIPHGMRMIELNMEKQKKTAQENYVLIIEDEENLRQILKGVLEDGGFQVILAADAKEGIGIYKSHHDIIELVLLDFHLPDTPGSVVFDKLREVNSSVKIILTSGFEFDDSIQETLNKGAIGFVGKPFNREQILSLVRQVYNYTVEH